MAQSVELVPDGEAEERLAAEWRLLRGAGLPSEQRGEPGEQHRPHLTLYAGDRVPDEAETALPSVLTGLDLVLRIGAPLVFGRSGRFILVRLVVPSMELLGLQCRVAQVCAADPHGPFGTGRWSPHVTLARRMTGAQVGQALDLLSRESASETDARVTRCRRWDGRARTAWWLT